MSDRFLLLDLHYTFAIDEGWHHGARLVDRIPRETYRTWIIDLAKEHEATVVLTTARPEIYAEATLSQIKDQTDWLPDGAYFRQIEGKPHEGKEHNLGRIIADYGQPTSSWIGFESNDRTRAMYRRYGIKSLPVHRIPPLTEWPDEPPQLPFVLP